MNRRNILKGLLAAPFASLLAPLNKLFGENTKVNPVFQASTTKGRPQRIDALSLKHWGKVANQPIEFYDVAGQTIFPRYGEDGRCKDAVCMVIFPVELPDGFKEAQPHYGPNGGVIFGEKTR